jgi:hypothetical protein
MADLTVEQLNEKLASTTEKLERMEQAFDKTKGQSSGLGSSFVTAGKQIATGVGSFTTAMANGQQGASAFNGAITSSASAVATLSKLLGPLGQAFGKLTEFAGAYVVRSTQMGDALFKTYQDLSRVGGAGAEGMDAVYNSMQQFGLTMNQMPEFGAMIAQNSESLAQLGGTVTQGIKTFAGVAAGIQQTGLQAEFERMGMTTKNINDGTISYLKIQAMTGASAAKSTAELTAGAAAYIEQQDKLSKLTGKSVETLAKEQEARLKDQRYAALNLEMTMKADAEDAAGNKEAAARIREQQAENTKLLEQTAPELKKGIQDLMAGIVNSPEAIQAFNATPEAAKKIMEQNFKAADIVNLRAAEASDLTKRNVGLAKTGNFDKVFGQYSAYIETANKTLANSAVVNEKTAQDQQDRQKEGANVDVNNQVAMREAQRATTQAMDDLVKKGVSPVIAGLSSMSIAIEKVVTGIPGVGEKISTKARAGEPASARGGYAPATAGYGTTFKPADFQTFLENSVTKGMDALKNVGSVTFSEKMDVLTGKNITITDSTVTSPAGEKTTTQKLTELQGQASAVPLMVPQSGYINVSSLDQFAKPEQTVAGPNTKYRTALDNNRPDPAKNETTTETSYTSRPELSQGIMELAKNIGLQTASMDELVDLMRRSLGVQGKILQHSRY